MNDRTPDYCAHVAAYYRDLMYLPGPYLDRYRRYGAACSPRPYGEHGEPQRTGWQTHTRWNDETGRYEDYTPGQ